LEKVRRKSLQKPDEPGSYTHRKAGRGIDLTTHLAGRVAARAVPGASIAPLAEHAASELKRTIERRRQRGTMERKLGALTEKQRAERVAAAKARWRKEGSLDMEAYHDTLHRHASQSLLGHDNKMARVKQEAEHFWHNVADTHEAYDKMKPHTEAGSHVLMEIPHSGGMLHNPSGIGVGHFSRFGRPQHKLYLMHPDEVDDWIAKHGKNAGVKKVEPYGVVEHIDELTEVIELDDEVLEKQLGSLIRAGIKRVGSAIGQGISRRAAGTALVPAGQASGGRIVGLSPAAHALGAGALGFTLGRATSGGSSDDDDKANS
jgi:hypothetical protein